MARVIGAICHVSRIGNSASIEVCACVVPESGDSFPAKEFEFSVLTDGSHTRPQINALVEAQAKIDAEFLSGVTIPANKFLITAFS